jgi:L-histidine N-alpha-methyltransferase
VSERARKSAAQSAAVDSAVAETVEKGLTRSRKSLPPWLLYDARGSELFEQITELPEYYVTRAEREIFDRHADEIVARAATGAAQDLRVVELGAGTATKSQILLRAVVRRQSRCLYVPIDVSKAALEVAVDRIEREEPRVDVRPMIVPHSVATSKLSQVARTRFVLFIGSSIGNFDERDAVGLLSAVRRGLDAGDAFLLGADRKKSPDVLIPAYDDAQGVTAAFNKNLLARINRELGADFDLAEFDHVALWNDELSRVEMHLESRSEQRVHVARLGLDLCFAAGERIHTESSHKYSDEAVQDLLDRSGFDLEQSFFDGERRFGVHVARARG